MKQNYLNENFGAVKAKRSEEEALRKWRSLCGLVKSRKRRFRFTANLSMRYEATAMRRTNQEKSSTSVLVSNAARQFLQGTETRDDTVPEDVKETGLHLPLMRGIKFSPITYGLTKVLVPFRSSKIFSGLVAGLSSGLVGFPIVKDLLLDMLQAGCLSVSYKLGELPVLSFTFTGEFEYRGVGIAGSISVSTRGRRQQLDST